MIDKEKHIQELRDEYNANRKPEIIITSLKGMVSEGMILEDAVKTLIDYLHAQMNKVAKDHTMPETAFLLDEMLTLQVNEVLEAYDTIVLETIINKG